MFFQVIKTILIPIANLLFHLTYENRENLPKTGGYIVAANHKSMLDPVFICVGIKRQIHYMAKQELFKNRLLAWIFLHLGAIPVARGARDSAALDNSIAVVNSGRLLGIFPEGTRSKTGRPMTAKAGVAFIAKAARCGVVPVAIIFEGRLRFRRHITVRFGEPIPYGELGFIEGDEGRSALKAVSRNVMHTIIRLMGLEPEECFEGNNS